MEGPLIESVDRVRLLEIARVEMADRQPIRGRPVGHCFHHGRRTAEIAVRLIENLEIPRSEIDPDNLWAAGLFHDVGKDEEPHEETGAVRTGELLASVVDRTRLDEIVGWIRVHNQRGRPELSLAAHILQDADLLDHHGAQIAWLSFQWTASASQDPWDAAKFYFGAEHTKYLDRCRETLNLAVSRDVFDRRRVIGDEFFRRFRAELDGEL